jgi:hypothetical protein
MNIDYDNELYLCIDCAKDSKLKKYILQNKTKKHVCSFCHKVNKITLDIFKNISFDNFLRALIRYHYWEDEYNRHFGGVDYLSNLLDCENPLINSDRIVDDTVKECLFFGAEDCDFDDHPNIVELFYGHNEIAGRLSFGERIKDRRNLTLTKLEDELLQKNYYLLENRVIKEIQSYAKYYQSTLEVNQIFYRGRTGFSKVLKKKDFDYDFTKKEGNLRYISYKGKDIGAPPIKSTKSGRLNRHGVSFLYLATDINTAISELRPHPGDKISIGAFKCIKKLIIVDFDQAFIRLSQTEEALEKFIYLNHIDQLFSKPIIPSKNHLYVITQFFADIFRKIGFDGISFSSSVSTGQNILIFDPSNFKYTRKDANVYSVNSLKYNYELT